MTTMNRQTTVNEPHNTYARGFVVGSMGMLFVTEAADAYQGLLIAAVIAGLVVLWARYTIWKLKRGQAEP